MDFTHGLLFFVIGCSITVVGFFIAFLVIRYNAKKELERVRKQNEYKVHPYGDDTVWVITLETLEHYLKMLNHLR